MHPCPASRKSILINPDGKLRMCCTDLHHMREHISQVDDLEEYFYSDKMKNIRYKMDDEGMDYKPCEECKSGRTSFVMDGYIDRHEKDPSTVNIEYVEITPSNICTQTCVMCIPEYSSKLTSLWKKNNISNYKNYVMPEKDFNKILKIVPMATTVFLKGGEPFADKKNLKIINNMNENALLMISSNGHSIPQDFQNALTSFIEDRNGKVNVQFSIDGSDEVFKWVRGSDYEEVKWNMESFYVKNKQHYDIFQSVTCFTLPTIIEDSKRFFIGCKNIYNMNIVEDWSSPKMYPQEYLDKFDMNIKSYSAEKKKSLGPRYKFMVQMFNKERGFDIYDYVPDLHLIDKEI